METRDPAPHVPTESTEPPGLRLQSLETHSITLTVHETFPEHLLHATLGALGGITLICPCGAEVGKLGRSQGGLDEL